MNLRNCVTATLALVVMACLLVAMWPADIQAQDEEWEWQMDTDYMLTGVWGSSGSDVFAVGRGGILHYDGWSWSDMGVNFEAFG
ncbi:MAG: hypothetical protein GWN93_06310, partial [Deltaproteobacteria bacterium]|nr:hypothetical protein [Deltaproteobacteria bacterium]